MEFYLRMFWRYARLISDESIHVCKHESKAYKHTKIICFCRPDVHFQWERLIVSLLLIIRQKGESQNNAYQGKEMLVFQKTWHAFISCNHRFEICPFALLILGYQMNKFYKAFSPWSNINLQEQSVMMQQIKKKKNISF